MLSNATLDFAGNAVGRPYYKRDWNNFGPNVGIAYQPFGDNKTVLRAGYSVNFPNDEFMASVRNSLVTNSGLESTRNLQNLNNVFLSNPTPIPTPRTRCPARLPITTPWTPKARWVCPIRTWLRPTCSSGT
jgi:hypothetical protein